MLEGLTPPKKPGICRVGELLQKLDEKDQEILKEALSDRKRWSHMALAKALTERGLSISSSSIQRHRTGLCAND